MIRRLLFNQGSRDKVAVIENDKEVRYSGLIDKALALRPLLPRKQRENIAILLPNGSDYIAAFWGTIGAGMTAFPLNTLMTEHEIAPLLKHARASAVITSAAYRGLFEKIAVSKAGSINIICVEELKTASGGKDCPSADIGPHEPMVLLNTSGTTGAHKIVQLSERNVEASVLGYLDKLRLEEMDLGSARFILAAPFSSVYGVMILSACLKQSFPIVVLDQVFTLDALFRTAEKHRVTHYEGSASAILLMERMIGRVIPYDVSALTYFGTGGSKVSGGTIDKLHNAYEGKEFFHGYGMTEASPLITKHPRAKVVKTESVGTAINGLEIAVDTDEGIVRTPYTEGEILVRGPNVMLGYYDNEPETKRALKNGYLHTGDIGYLDEEGYLYIRGRKKNMIIVRGFKVYPEEVEECVLNSLLAGDCVVYGQTDGFGCEKVCADIVPVHPRVRADEIRAYCEEHLAAYKIPSEITFCQSVKRNASGKHERKREGSSD